MAIFLPGARMVYRHCAPWIIADLKTASHAVSHFHRPAWKQPRPKVVDGIHRALGEQEKILLCPPNVDEARQRVQIERKQFLEIHGYDVFVRGFILIFWVCRVDGDSGGFLHQLHIYIYIWSYNMWFYHIIPIHFLHTIRKWRESCADSKCVEKNDKEATKRIKDSGEIVSGI